MALLSSEREWLLVSMVPDFLSPDVALGRIYAAPGHGDYGAAWNGAGDLLGCTVKLNLGCSDTRINGFLGVDVCPPADVVADLRLRWPWEDSSVEEILAHDVLEHLPQIHGLNEAHRVLRPGGKLNIKVPAIALTDGRVNPGAFCDPTHISWWLPDTRYYFCEEWNNQQGERGRLGPAYGITALFRPLSWELVEYGLPHERRSKMVGIWEAVK